MVHVLGRHDNPLYELDGADEVRELEGLGDRVALALPALQLGEPRLDRLVVEQVHAVEISLDAGASGAASPVPGSAAIVNSMRIASLVPSATEMLFALGLGDGVVAVTHECDYPPEATTLPRLTRSVIPAGLTPGEIDAAVREVTAQGRALYELDEEALVRLDVDLIVTQALCAVCAVSYDDVRAVAGRLPDQTGGPVTRPGDPGRGARRLGSPGRGDRRA